MCISAKGVKMSKIKDELERIHEIEYEQYISFMEWVCDQQPKVSNDDVNEVGKDPSKLSTKGTSILYQKALNNPNYNPKLGA